MPPRLVNPFEGLPEVDGSYVIHQTERVQYLIRRMLFATQVRFKLKDHQFALSGHILHHGKYIHMA